MRSWCRVWIHLMCPTAESVAVHQKFSIGMSDFLAGWRQRCECSVSLLRCAPKKFRWRGKLKENNNERETLKEWKVKKLRAWKCGPERSLESHPFSAVQTWYLTLILIVQSALGHDWDLNVSTVSAGSRLARVSKLVCNGFVNTWEYCGGDTCSSEDDA